MERDPAWEQMMERWLEQETEHPTDVTIRPATQAEESPAFVLGAIAVLILTVLILGACLSMPWWAISHARYYEDTPYREKHVLNIGGLGWLYEEGARCLVDLRATFEPLGTLEGKEVARYAPRESWHDWKQCPPGTLVLMDQQALHLWQEAYAVTQAHEAERNRERLRGLIEKSRNELAELLSQGSELAVAAAGARCPGHGRCATPFGSQSGHRARRQRSRSCTRH